MHRIEPTKNGHAKIIKNKKFQRQKYIGYINYKKLEMQIEYIEDAKTQRQKNV